MNPEIPLVVPWINVSKIKEKRIIANANCSIIPCITVLKPLNERYHITKVNYTTYQSVSGSGFKGINDLMRTRTIEKPLFYPQPIALTCIPFIGRDYLIMKPRRTENERRPKDSQRFD